jgi:hypothetical protein
MKAILILLAVITSLSAVRSSELEVSVGRDRDRDHYEHWREVHRWHRHQGYWAHRRYWDDDRGGWVRERVWIPYEQ